MTHHEYTGQLLDRAFLRLVPDVFFHPVWTHFVEGGASLTPEQIQSLLDAGNELLLAGCLVEACQIFFICAFQQLRTSDYSAASTNIQRILVVAEQHRLPQVARWATWGAAAVCVQRGGFQQTAVHLEHLQSMLGRQHEWVLSDVIDVLRQGLLCQAEVTPTDRLLSSDAALSSAFEQLLHWGTPRAASGINYDDLISGGHPSRPAMAPAVSTGFTRRSLWRSIKRIVKGELRLKWVEAGGAASPAGGDERHAFITEVPPAAASGAAREPLPKSAPVPLQSELAASGMTEPEVERFAGPTPRTRPSEAEDEKQHRPSLAVYCLGPFRVYLDNQPITEWKSLKGYSILKYLVTHGRKPIAKDILMDVFWPDADPMAARRNLHQAIYALRQMFNQALPNLQQIQFENDCYRLNPELDVWIDFDEFEQHARAGQHLEVTGQLAEAAAEYSIAEGLYQGDFLEEDLYEDWPSSQREQLRNTYLDLAERLSEYYVLQSQYHLAITLCHKILNRDRCHEGSHRRLMTCYLAQGQRHLAIRQYHTCVQALAEELDVPPADETRSLYASISANS